MRISKRMKVRAAPFFVASLALMLAAGGIAASARSPVRDPEGLMAGEPLSSVEGSDLPMTLEHFDFVGHSELDGFADYGDVWGHGNYAYVGSRCGEDGRGGDGVQVVSLRDAEHASLVSTLSNRPDTRVEDVVVIHVDAPTFSGELGVVGVQACNETEVAPGLRFFDVSDPRHPIMLSHWNLHRGTAGCHEIDAVQRDDGLVLAGCARSSIDHDVSYGKRSVNIIDATDPDHPTSIAKWTLGADPIRGTGWLPKQFAHSVRFQNDGMSLYVSNWDAGTVNLDISKPTSPKIVRVIDIIPPDEDGDNHSMTLANHGRWLVINTEDFSPVASPGVAEFGGWGEVYVYDNRDETHPRLLGTFSTDNSRSTRTDGIYSDHNTEVVYNDQFFSSWYADGIVWWTMNKRGVTHQLGHFVPPGPEGSPFIWGVYPLRHKSLILASDTLTGLWIVRPEDLDF